MRIVITTVQVPFIQGGAEILAQGLLNALTERGYESEIVAIPFKWYPAERIPAEMLICRMLDLTESNGVPIDRVIGLKFPAYLIPHPNKVLWLLHQHRQAYDLWEIGGINTEVKGHDVRETIISADNKLIPEAKAVFTIAKNVSARLSRFNGIVSEPLYHPPQSAEQFYTATAEDYFYYPSRLNSLKRQDLVIRALAKTSHPVRIIFSGAPDTAEYLNELKALAEQEGVANRIEWLGRVSEHKKLDLYASCLGVIFPPVDEDYGYITLEAMLSSKPIITCTDSGGPLEFVRNGINGRITEPTSLELAVAMDELWKDRDIAIKWGKASREIYAAMNISWDHVVERLLA